MKEALTVDNMDNVNHPKHYTNGNIEVKDYIRDKLSTPEWVGYCIGNVIKYVSRWKFKGGVEDLEKAAVYLDWAIQDIKECNNVTNPRRNSSLHAR